MKKMNFLTSLPMLIVTIYAFVFSPLLISNCWAVSDNYLESAIKSYDKRNYEGALEKLRQALRVSGTKDKDLAEIHKYFGYIYISLEQWNKAIDEFVIALYYDPSLQIEQKNSSQKVLDAFNRAREEAGIKQEDGMSPVISHMSVKNAVAGSSIEIRAAITDNRRVTSTKLYYRKKNQTEFMAVPMGEIGANDYSAKIPGKFVVPGGVEYFIEAVDASANRSTKGTSDTPLAIRVEGGERQPAVAAAVPLYKKWWVWAIAGGTIGVVAIAVSSGGGGGGDGGGNGSITISW